MRVYLDDERQAPIGWTRTTKVCETIELLRTNKVTHLSLDHDLGCEKTGYDVLLWIEQEMGFNKFNPPIIKIHTANSSARVKMELAVYKIQKMKYRL